MPGISFLSSFSRPVESSFSVRSRAYSNFDSVSSRHFSSWAEEMEQGLATVWFAHDTHIDQVTSRRVIEGVVAEIPVAEVKSRYLGDLCAY
jgi:hypothetical protein